MRQTVSLLSIALLVQSAFAAELPVRKVILYKHGIGFFERGGEIPAGQSARLDFKASEMNDVLKSLTIVDLTGNSVAGVRYDSSLPLSSKLAEFPFRLGERTPLTDFFDQLKGAAVEMKTGPAVKRGQIVGARVAQSRDKAQTSTEVLSVLTESGDIETHDLGSVSSVRLVDPELQRQLSEYLRSLNVSRSREQKSVYVDSTKDAARKLNVAYTIPMPSWKSSYRLVLDAGTAKKPILEGWAIIDNTTNEDWTKVDLSVISGRPVSFVSRLYEPKFMQREVAELAEDKALAPKVYKGAMAEPPPAPLAGGFGSGNGIGGGQYKMAGQMRSTADTPMLETSASSTITVSAGTRDAGELFEYKFSQPVTVKRNESAMLPFVQQEVSARKLLIFTQGSSEENPWNSVELTNNTGKTLDGGPLSVYDGGIYAGEALVNTFKANDKRLLSYALDLGTRVVEDNNGGEAVIRTIKARQATVTVTSVAERTTTYKITNVDKKAKTLIIEHRKDDGNKLIGAKPMEETATHYRFEVKLTGDAGQTFQLKEEETILDDVHITNSDEAQLGMWISSNRLSADAKRILQGIMDLRAQATASNQAIKMLNLQVTESTNDQERVRRNLASLNSVSGQQERVQKYASDLAALDAKIVGLRDQIAAETKKFEGLNQQLAARINSANF